MLVGNIISVVRTAVLLGRFFVSKTSAQEREQLKLRLREWKSSDKIALFEKILDEEELEKRRSVREQCDVDRAWNQVQLRLGEHRRRTRVKRYMRRLQSLAAAVAIVLVTAGIIYESHAGRQRRIMARIAQIRPGGAQPTLYFADGRCVELGRTDSLPDLGNARINGRNSLTYQSQPTAGTTRNRNSQPQEEVYNTLITPRGCTCDVTLADGTRVWLNAASRLRFFTTDRCRERVVMLDGEAYFEVAHDAARPFIVVSGDQRIRVLGTHFNIKAYDAERTVYTTLVEGSVEVTPCSGGEGVRLSPGEQAVYRRDTGEPIDVARVDPSQALAWRSGNFIFSHATISEILEELSRWYRFEYDVAPYLDEFSFSGQFPRCGELDRILEIITSTGTGIKIDYDGERITLK